MNSEQFTYWLKGYFELSDSDNLSPQQVQIIKDHLNLVFTKVTPDRNITETYITETYITETYCGRNTTVDTVESSRSTLRLCAGHTGIDAKGLCQCCPD